MLETIVQLGAVAAIVVAFFQTRLFVRRRLQFVDSVQSLRAPIIAGATATLLAAPIVWLLPYVGTGSALLFGLAVGGGVMAGSRDVRRRLPHG